MSDLAYLEEVDLIASLPQCRHPVSPGTSAQGTAPQFLAGQLVQWLAACRPIMVRDGTQLTLSTGIDAQDSTKASAASHPC